MIGLICNLGSVIEWILVVVILGDSMARFIWAKILTILLLFWVVLFCWIGFILLWNLFT